MALKQTRVNHYTVALTTATPKNLLDALGGAPDNWIRFLSIQAHPANVAVVYVGGANATLSSSDYGARIEVPSAGPIPDAPLVFELPPGSCKLSDFWVLGNTNDEVQLLVITEI